MKLKKILKRVVLIISILLFLFWGILKYREYQSYKNTIPANADLIVKISTDNILSTIAWNAIKNPLYYLSRSKKKDAIKKTKRGFQIPANFFAFNLKGDKNTFYTILKLKDSSNFRKFVQKKIGDSELSKTENFASVSALNNKLTIIFNDKKAVVAYQLNNKNSMLSIEKLLTDFTQIDDKEKLSDLKKIKSHISIFKDLENHVDLNFNDGKINLQGEIYNNFLQITDDMKMATKSDSSYLYFSMLGKPLKNDFGNITLKNFSFPIDSILKNYSGSTTLQLSGTTKQSDTIITYEYDDDFEKIEVKSVEEKNVPGINIILSGKSSKLKQVFEQHQIITDNKLNNKIFPLYQLNFKTTNNIVEFSNQPSKNLNYINTEHFAEIFINFDDLLDHNNLNISYIHKLNDLRIKAYNKKEKVTVNGTLVLKNTSLNSLIYLLLD
jgi:hypothetical protein